MLDYTELGEDREQLTGEIAKSKLLIGAEPPGTVLTLTDVRSSKITPGNVIAMQDLVKYNAEFVKWSAVVVGLTGVYLTGFRAIQALTRRKNLQSFGGLDEAKEWLVSQP
jgi:hypothetical protein